MAGVYWLLFVIYFWIFLVCYAFTVITLILGGCVHLYNHIIVIFLTDYI